MILVRFYHKAGKNKCFYIIDLNKEVIITKQAVADKMGHYTYTHFSRLFFLTISSHGEGFYKGKVNTSQRFTHKISQTCFLSNFGLSNVQPLLI